MQNTFKLAAVAAVCAMATAAHAQVAFDANLELDTTYTNKVEKPNTNARESDVGMGGRIEVNAAAKGTSSGGGFVAGRGTLLLKKDGSTAVDDMWVQFGNAGMDVKAGRFEAMDLFPLGKDTVLEEAGYSAYKANKLRGRFGSDTVHTALGLNAGPARVEVGLVYSKDKDAVRGLRPAVSFTSGAMTVRAGLESVKVVGGSDSSNGVGVSLGFAMSSDSSVNLNLAKMEDDKSVGVNATFGPAGAGMVYGKGATAAAKVNTFYAAYSLPLFGVKGASMTPAISLSKGGKGTDNQVAARLRINYAF